MQSEAGIVPCQPRALWWRWRESNPRPKSSTRDIYKLSRLLLLPGESPPTALHPGGADGSRNSRLGAYIGVKAPHTGIMTSGPRPTGERPGRT